MKVFFMKGNKLAEKSFEGSFGSKEAVDFSKNKEKLSVPKNRGEFIQSPEYTQSAEVRSAAKAEFNSFVRFGRIDDALKTRDKFNLPPEYIQSAEVQSAAKEGAIFYLRKTDSDRLFRFLDEFNLPSEFFRSPEVQLLAKKMLIAHFGRGFFLDASEIIERCYLPQDV